MFMGDSKWADGKGKSELAGNDAVGKSEGVHNKAVSGASRRDFFKRAAVVSVAVVSATSAAKMVASLAKESDPQKAYLRDVLPGDRVLGNRDYVEMTEEEKEKRLQVLVKNYKYHR